MWLDKGSEFYNRSMKSWLQDNDWYRNVFNKITKENLLLLKDLLEPQRTKFTNIWLQYQKNVYIDKMADIINEHNNTCHKTIKMKHWSLLM